VQFAGREAAKGQLQLLVQVLVNDLLILYCVDGSTTKPETSETSSTKNFQNVR